MKIRDYFTPSIFLTVAFVVSVFLLFFIASLSFKQIQALSYSQQSLIHSYQVRIDLEQLFSELKDAEAGQRGYIITRETQYLEPYNYSEVRINKSLIAIKELTKKYPRRQREFDTLSQLINERYRLLRVNIRESERMSTSSYDFKLKMWKGKRMMDDIRAQINSIIKNEEHIIQLQEKKHGDEISFTPITSLFIVAFSVLVFLFTFHRINSNLHVMKKLNRRLKLVNEAFVYAEHIGEIGHWQLDLKTGVLTFSDNKFSLLGCEPQSFEPSVDSFMEFVYPADRKLAAGIFEKEATAGEAFSTYYRIVRKDKKVRYFKSISKLTQDTEGREIIIGIDCDVTQQYRNTVKLERKNKELKMSNAELNSFNHIVSHDLQEPLRKIQMFISRIDEKELEEISENSRNYFTKIRTSANRAQKLIDDLLLYSRTNRSEKKFEMADLNTLLENAKNDLAQVIEDKNATVKLKNLPKLKVIPFQLQQVFVNLISNSVKYSKDDVPPVITVSAKTVESKDFPEMGRPVNKKYHEITFADNGIGFAPIYVSRIFTLFYRLHDKEKYSGTGIGLAICKKMIENHDGYIFAEGEPGKGATFRIYLPA